MEFIYFLPVIFFVVAVLYSMVGFGGGSSYIAILLACGMAVDELRITALLCNIAVVGIASFQYYQNNLINWNKLLPIILCSIPFAFLGAKITVDEPIYKTVAGIVLIIAAVLMLLWNSQESENTIEKGKAVILGITGGGIGFLSGFVGIGGGIFLSPLLFLFKWEKAKKISAMCSVFILVNSLAGLVGHSSKFNLLQLNLTCTLIGAVILGGLLGNQLNIKRLKPQYIRILSASLIAFVGIRLLIT